MSDSFLSRVSASKAILYVLAKEPTAGSVKTRLTPPLSPQQAATAATAFLEDTLDMLAQVRALSGAGRVVEVRVAAAPDSGGSLDRIARLADRYGVVLEDQGEGDLGHRMERLMERGLALPSAPVASGGTSQEGMRPRRVVLLGADSPDLPISRLDDAIDALADHDVVIGPARDGGYYLIGANRPVRDLFSPGVAWGGPDVFRATRDRLNSCERDAAGDRAVSLATLPPWQDLDDIGDFAAFMARGDSGSTFAPRSRALGLEFRARGLPV